MAVGHDARRRPRDADGRRQTFALLGDAAVGDAEVRRPGLDHEDLIAAVEAAPTPAASPTDWPRPWLTALAPPQAIPTIDEQPVALLEDAAVGDAEVRGPGLDLRTRSPPSTPCPRQQRRRRTCRGLPWPSVTALAPPSAIPTIADQTVALLGDSAVGDEEIRGLGLDLEDLIAAVEAALTPAALPSPDPTVALLDDAAVVNAEISGLGLDLEALIAAVDAASAPAAAPTDVPWPSVTALAPPSAMPTSHDPTIALLEDSAVVDAEIRGLGLDHGDLIAAVDAAPASSVADGRAVAVGHGTRPALGDSDARRSDGCAARRLRRRRRGGPQAGPR